MRGKVLVTPRSATKPVHSSLLRIEQAGFELVIPTPGETPGIDIQLSLAREIDGYLAGVEKIDSEFLHLAKKLKVISRNGTGSDAIDLETAKDLGIEVRTAPASNAQGVAELTLALMLSAGRQLSHSSGAFAEGRWERRLGEELSGSTLGLVGCGQIGKKVANLALAFGMKVIAFDAYPDQTFSPVGPFKFASLDEVISESKFISLHCPPSREPVISSQQLSAMQPGAYLINTARFGLVDLDAVQAALDLGHLSAYACDAFEPEPPAPHPIYQHQRFIGTAHIGGYTKASVDRALYSAVDNLLAVLES